MALTKFEKDLNIIAKLDDEPNDVGGLTAAELKAKFDEGGLTLQKYINEALIPGLEALLDALNENKADKDELRGVVLNQVPDGTITNPKIADAAISTEKVADEAITAEKLSVEVQESIDSRATQDALDGHTGDTNNPHKVTAGQVGVSDTLAEQLGIESPAFAEGALAALGADLQSIHDSVSASGDTAKIAQIQTDSYVGNGEYGESNPTEITFNFAPKIFMAFDSVGRLCDFYVRGAGGYWLLHTDGLSADYKNVYKFSSESCIIWAKKSDDGKTISFYADSAEYQLNTLNEKYYFVGIG